MTLFGCDNILNIASTGYVDCVVTTVSGHLQDEIDASSSNNFPNNSSIYLNGVDAFLQRTDVNSDEIGSGVNFTVNVWTKLADNSADNEGWSNLVDFQASSAAGDRLRFIAMHDFGPHTRTLVYDAGSGASDQTTDNVYNFDQWHMFTVDVNNTEYKFYVDGALQTNEVTGDSYDLNTDVEAALGIGFGDLNNYVRGFMRHCSIHKGSLSSTEIGAIYNSGTAIDLRQNQGNYTTSSDLTHYWFLGDDDDLGPEGIRDRAGDLHLTASGSPIIVKDTPHRS